MNLKIPPANLITQLLVCSKNQLARTSLPYTKTAMAITSILLRHGLLTSLTLGSPTTPNPQLFDALPVSSKRLWVDFKHRDGIPVLRSMKLVSKSSKRVMVDRDELGRILTGRRAKGVPGVGLGELLIIRSTAEKTYHEGWEAWRAGKGGEIVCRVG